MGKIIIILLFCSSVFSQEKISISSVISTDAINRIIECHELEIQYHIQKELIRVQNNIEKELRYSYNFQQKETERLKRVNQNKDIIIDSYIEDTIALQKAYHKERNKNKLFSFPSVGKIALGFLTGVITVKAISD